MNRHLHIIALDVPWPADYGGAIDMLYRIKSLYQSGVKIHLHYFSYNNRGNPNELNQFCESIHIYERRTGHRGFSTKLPYIVASRINAELVEKLNEDAYPILIEGVHCTGILSGINASIRKIVVRLHNDESAYYKQLARATRNVFRKFYYIYEGRLLEKYQAKLPSNCIYACISNTDLKTFREKFRINQAFLLPAFTPYQEIKGQEGIGNFCLYHGNLSVPENEKAAAWLMTKVFPQLSLPLVIAGKNPSPYLSSLAKNCKHTCLVANPSASEINDLVQKAHINVLPAFNSTGIKLKLLHALFEGRHCVTNDAMVDGTGLESACHIGTTAIAMASIITQLHHQPYSEEETRLRKRLLGDTYNNEKNTSLLTPYLW